MDKNNLLGSLVELDSENPVFTASYL